MKGQRHLVKCRCVLSQFKSQASPPVHQFMVFSMLDDNDNVVVKHAQCNNCGLVHRVTDICTSEILRGKEQLSSLITIDDVKLSLPKNLVDILERNNVDISTWELAQFIVENKRWGDIVLLSHEEEGGVRHGKYVRIIGENLFKVDNYTREEITS